MGASAAPWGRCGGGLAAASDSRTAALLLDSGTHMGATTAGVRPMMSRSQASPAARGNPGGGRRRNGGAQIASKPAPDRPRMKPKSTPDRHHIASGSAQFAPKPRSDPTSTRHRPQIAPGSPPERSRIDPTSALNPKPKSRPQIATGTTPNRPQVDCKSTADRQNSTPLRPSMSPHNIAPRFAPESPRGRPQIDPKSTSTRPQLDRRSTGIRPRIGQSLARVCSKAAPRGKELSGISTGPVHQGNP